MMLAIGHLALSRFGISFMLLKSICRPRSVVACSCQCWPCFELVLPICFGLVSQGVGGWQKAFLWVSKELEGQEPLMS